MIVKPVITFLSRVSDADLITITGGIVSAMTNNPNYPAPAPALPVVSAALTEFAQALADAADGGMSLTAIKNDKRKALVGLMRHLASYVQVACKRDLAVLLSSGFPTHKPDRQSSGIPPAPSVLTVALGGRSGELQAIASPVVGAAIYNWQLSTAAEPTVILQSVQTTAARSTFGGLTPGVIYRVTVNALNSTGPGDWANPVLQMAV
jgi:hypothetical protein